MWRSPPARELTNRGCFQPVGMASRSPEAILVPGKELRPLGRAGLVVLRTRAQKRLQADLALGGTSRLEARVVAAVVRVLPFDGGTGLQELASRLGRQHR